MEVEINHTANERTSRGHYCVDYCQPPEHADLCHMGVEYDDVGNHLVFEADYWQLYRVVVTRVIRRPEYDGLKAEDLGLTPKGEKISTIAIRQGDTIADKAFEVRWRGDLQREPNRFKRLHSIRHIYGACKFTNCDLIESVD
jgi:hypothetical protein